VEIRRVSGNRVAALDRAPQERRSHERRIVVNQPNSPPVTAAEEKRVEHDFGVPASTDQENGISKH
jgi:hypothetical protein